MSEAKSAISELLRIMAQLRGQDGCPWDRKQNHTSLRPYVIEEAYELVDAINGGNGEEVREELGDLLLQIVFHCQIASEEKRFDFNDVVNGICEKLIRRHPHVFGDESAATEEEALKNWERIKIETEGKRKTKRHFESPILHRTLRLQERAVSFGFDWEEPSQLLAKLEEEIAEIREAVDSGDSEDIMEEVGDLFFMAVNLARFLEIHPEEALEGTLSKFSKRFRAMEDLAQRDDRSLEQMDIDEMEQYWEEAKKKEKEEGERRKSSTKC